MILGKYKNGKPNREISVIELIKYLEKATFIRLSHKAYFVLLYWIGARRTEPLNLLKEDLREESDRLFMKIPAFKHGERGGEIELPMDLPGIIFLKNRWIKTRKHRRLFPFATSTSWRIIKRVDPKLSPHWFRHNRITKFRKLLDLKKISKDDIKSWTGIKSDRTIEGYGMKTQEGISKIAKLLE